MINASPSWNFPACLDFTIGPGPASGGEEGPYSNDPRDPGGPTNYGVTLSAWSDWLQRPAARQDIENLTRPDVVPFYTAKYWNATRCWGLHVGVDLMVFDFGVNAGVKCSALLLQQVVDVTQDEVVGPLTCLAAKGYGAEALIEALHAAHTAHYQSLLEFPIYGKGWLARVDRSRIAALAMLPEVV